MANDDATTRPIQNLPVWWAFLLHTVVAVFGSMLIGIGPEAFVSKYYYNTGIEPYSPAILTTALVLGYFVNRKLGNRAAQWVWVSGLLWLLFGAYDESRYWANSFAASRLSYVMDNFFGPTLKCSGSECFCEVLFTTVFSATVGYSAAAAFGLRSHRKRQQLA
jgi:hypothetical protein